MNSIVIIGENLRLKSGVISEKLLKYFTQILFQCKM